MIDQKPMEVVPGARPCDEMPLPNETIVVGRVRVFATPGGPNERPAVVVCGQIEGKPERFVVFRLSSLDILSAFGRSLADAGRRVFRLPNPKGRK